MTAEIMDVGAHGLKLLRYGRAGARPKAYLQAAIHAEEIPPLLVADHLRRALDALDAQGRVRGEIVLVPAANPIGLTQFVMGTHLGRFDLDSGVNFNRQYPDLVAPLRDRVASQLGTDAQANVRAIRSAALALLAEAQPKTDTQALKLELFRAAVDADLVLDLHCDYEAALHVYLGTSLWPATSDLPAELGATVTLLADDAGGSSFEEACAGIWWNLKRAFPQAAIPLACVAATIEYRGERDVDDARAADDAQRLVNFLARRGVVDAPVGALRAVAAATPLEGVDYLDAPHAGVVVHRHAPGARIARGELVAELLDPRSGERTRLAARNDGVLFARRGHRWVTRGQWVAKIAGVEPLPWRRAGALLSD